MSETCFFCFIGLVGKADGIEVSDEQRDRGMDRWLLSSQRIRRASFLSTAHWLVGSAPAFWLSPHHHPPGPALSAPIFASGRSILCIQHRRLILRDQHHHIQYTSCTSKSRERSTSCLCYAPHHKELSGAIEASISHAFLSSPTLHSDAAQNASILSCEDRCPRPKTEGKMQYTALLFLTCGGGHRIGTKRPRK